MYTLTHYPSRIRSINPQSALNAFLILMLLYSLLAPLLALEQATGRHQAFINRPESKAEQSAQRASVLPLTRLYCRA